MIYTYLFQSNNWTAIAVRHLTPAWRNNALAAWSLALLLVAGLSLGGQAVYAQEPMASGALATVNINTADAPTLAASLKGVGQSRAVEIVRYREAYGPFSSADELAEVKGIGQSTLEQNRKVITLE